MDAGGLACLHVALSRRSKSGDDQWVLSDIHATFNPGRLALIAGGVGAGKTTLLFALAGLLRPTEGEVLAGGRVVSRWVAGHRDRWRRKVGLVFQSPRLFPQLSALENVLAPLIPGGRSMKSLHRQGMETLEAAGVVHAAHNPVGLLSGGERQRVALARALVGKPEFLLADEPTTYQDGEGLQIVLENLMDTCRNNATVVVAAHDPRIKDSGVVDDCWNLQNGRLVRVR